MIAALSNNDQNRFHLLIHDSGVNKVKGVSSIHSNEQ